jgi:excisionase family DNA binding protein
MIQQLENGERLLTIKEVADLTGLAVGTLYHFVADKRIPVVRLSKRCVRFRPSDLRKWLDSLSESPLMTIYQQTVSKSEKNKLGGTK